MPAEKVWLVVRRRARALAAATVVVFLLWILAVLAVKVFAPSSAPGKPNGLPHELVRKGVSRLPGRLLRKGLGEGGVPLVQLHDVAGNPGNLAAWHTVVQCLILVTLAALVVALIDRLRRERRRLRTI